MTTLVDKPDDRPRYTDMMTRVRSSPRTDDDEAELSTLEEKLAALICDDATAIERLQKRMHDDAVVEEDEQ